MKKTLIMIILSFVLIWGIFIYFQSKNEKEVIQMGDLKLTSLSFQENAEIPDEHTCNGKNINPALNIQGTPLGTKTLTLIIDDSDAPSGTWVHWVIWNIPAETKEIKKNSVPQGALQGMNDFNKNEYGGPCPPSGAHRYLFKLYALDTPLDLDENSKKEDLEKAMQGHILAQTQLIGLSTKK